MEENPIIVKPADNGGVEVEEPQGEIRISVRKLVEFILRHGDIDNRHQMMAENAMQEGGRIHRMLQKRMGADYQAEVPLRYTHPAKGYRLIIEGRADGIIDNGGECVIDESKGTDRELSHMREPVSVHAAQAKCYAYLYGAKKAFAGQEEITIRLTYCNMETEELKYFYENYLFAQLQEWFGALVAEYGKWADYDWQWRKVRQESIEALDFPFPYREGQRELAADVYRTIYHKRKLFLEAPTGVGKTLSTIFPSVKAMGKGMGDKLFYLTAKTITRTVAGDAFALLRDRGLRFKCIILTAREKICFMEKAECNPEYCPFAKGHYDRINDAMFALLTAEENFTRETIEAYAREYRVCPFELCLDMSLFADGIIGDYNYLFDPHVYLKRFFGEGSGGEYLFLIDEAHNLVERGREMYSASLVKERFLELKREIKQTIVSELSAESVEKSQNKGIEGQMTLAMTGVSFDMTLSENRVAAMSEELSTSMSVSDSLSDIPPDASLSLKAQSQEMAAYRSKSPSRKGRKQKRGGGCSVLVREGYGELLMQQLENCNRELLELKRDCADYRLVEGIDGFVNRLIKLHGTLGGYLAKQEEWKLPVREKILDFYFEVSHFLMIYERLDASFVKYARMEEDGSFLLKLFCVNPGKNLQDCMLRGRSSILFSATFLPIQYYKELLGGEEQDYEVYAKSVFDVEKRALFIANDVTSKYSRRSEEEYGNIVRYIDEIVKNRHGNYMVFCPSYSFLRIIYERYVSEFAGADKECILQQDDMGEDDREAFLGRFAGSAGGAGDADGGLQTGGDDERTLIGFCVLGGIFGEGIDLKNDSLIGAVIVGTGLPQVCCEREILREYFDGHGENGFDYAYRYPGINKVLQAAGRVIRTDRDIGVIALLDERFLQFSYRRMFPKEWENFEAVSLHGIARRVERFWDSWPSVWKALPAQRQFRREENEGNDTMPSKVKNRKTPV